jgi:stage II sporulation protein D
VPGLSGRGLSWQRLAGESIALLTIRPDRDGAVLASAERLVRTLSQRTGWPIPANIEIRVYPDVDTFRNATGEPGWVAGYTDGHRIHLQPLRDAPDKVLAHELLHCLIESQAAPGLPLWFREGLAGYLERPGPAAARAPADADLRQTSDRARARRAYAESSAAVARLVNRYGEAAVLGWVKGSLPMEVTKANSSPPAMKSR